VEQGHYTVKPEGARTVGYLNIFIGAIRDPIQLSQVDSFIFQITAAVKQKTPFGYDLKIHVYGQSGVNLTRQYPEGGQHLCSGAGSCPSPGKPSRQHYQDTFYSRTVPKPIGYYGQLCLALGTVRYPHGYHIMRAQDPLELFPIKAHIHS
jgi:hypothetical protein